MSFKEKALAALDAFKNDSLGIVAATIEDCQELIRELPEHPCATCVRWEECNGVYDECPRRDDHG